MIICVPQWYYKDSNTDTSSSDMLNANTKTNTESDKIRLIILIRERRSRRIWKDAYRRTRKQRQNIKFKKKLNLDQKLNWKKKTKTNAKKQYTSWFPRIILITKAWKINQRRTKEGDTYHNIKYYDDSDPHTFTKLNMFLRE